MEIYTQSKHGIMFAAQQNLLNLNAPSDSLTTKDMFMPTCATCHMSGLNGRGVTHDPSDGFRIICLPKSPRRVPNAERAQAKMKDICLQCHTPPLVDRVYKEGAAVVDATNEKVLAAKAIMDSLNADGLISTNAVHARRSSLPISTSGITTGARRSTRRSWAARTMCNGTATIRFSSTWWNSRNRPPNFARKMENNWLRQPRTWVELFALFNLGGLAPDIFLAHSTNAFHSRAELVPLIFSLAAPVLLLPALWALATGQLALWRTLGNFIGWVSVFIGIVGLVLHLKSQFFQEWTLASLVYTAPFAAPLAYTGIGLLLILNRSVSAEFARMGGVGHLSCARRLRWAILFSVSPTTRKMVFSGVEWIPVIASALAVGFLTVPLVARVDRGFFKLCFGLLALQVIVGLTGFALHLQADLNASGKNLFGEGDSRRTDFRTDAFLRSGRVGRHRHLGAGLETSGQTRDRPGNDRSIGSCPAQLPRTPALWKIEIAKTTVAALFDLGQGGVFINEPYSYRKI